VSLDALHAASAVLDAAPADCLKTLVVRAIVGLRRTLENPKLDRIGQVSGLASEL
jgi:hypothetical protein